MGTDRDGLDSILAGNEEGAKGCCLSVDMTSDGIAVLLSDGYVPAPPFGASTSPADESPAMPAEAKSTGRQQPLATTSFPAR